MLHLYYFWLNVCLNLLIITTVLNFICFLKYLVLLVFISKWLFQLVLTRKNTEERVRKVLLFVFCLFAINFNESILWILVIEKPLFQNYIKNCIKNIRFLISKTNHFNFICINPDKKRVCWYITWYKAFVKFIIYLQKQGKTIQSISKLT